MQLEKVSSITRVGRCLLLAAACAALNGCAVVAVVDAGVSVAATAVSTAVSVAGTAISTTAKVGGAAIDALLPDGKKDPDRKD